MRLLNRQLSVVANKWLLSIILGHSKNVYEPCDWSSGKLLFQYTPYTDWAS